jgi:ABC-2 type transport system ATP-binding protein
LCDRIVLINRGRNVLYGHLNDIRREYAGNAVLLKVAGDLPALNGVQAAIPHNGSTQLMLGRQMTPQDILSQLVASHTRVEQFEIAAPTLDEIFIKVVQAGDEGGV